jgi:putative membrane protein
MTKFKTIIGGFFVGLANIIPGVSGGTMAVIFGIYDQLIQGILSLFKTPIQTIKALLPILLGVVIGIIFGVFVIDLGYQKVPLLTTLVFIGLILGGVHSIAKKIQTKDFKHWVSFGLACLIMVLLPILNSNLSVHTGWVYYVMIILVGFIAAGTMIAPGISGSLVLLLLGYYAHVLGLAKDAIEAVLTLNIEQLWSVLPAVIAFLIGALLGLLVFSKLISIVMHRYESLFYAAVLGLLVSSPISILTLLNQDKALHTFGWIEVFFGILLCIGAAYGSYVLIKNSEN